MLKRGQRRFLDDAAETYDCVANSVISVQGTLLGLLLSFVAASARVAQEWLSTPASVLVHRLDWIGTYPESLPPSKRRL